MMARLTYSQIMEEARDLGAKHFLLKPFPLECLGEVLTRALPAVFVPGRAPGPPEEVRRSA